METVNSHAQPSSSYSTRNNNRKVYDNEIPLQRPIASGTRRVAPMRNFDETHA